MNAGVGERGRLYSVRNQFKLFFRHDILGINSYELTAEAKSSSVFDIFLLLNDVRENARTFFFVFPPKASHTFIIMGFLKA